MGALLVAPLLGEESAFGDGSIGGEELTAALGLLVGVIDAVEVVVNVEGRDGDIEMDIKC
jgi:hypothetical protein